MAAVMVQWFYARALHQCDQWIQMSPLAPHDFNCNRFSTSLCEFIVYGWCSRIFAGLPGSPLFKNSRHF